MLYYHLLLFLNKHEKVRVRMDGVGGQTTITMRRLQLKKVRLKVLSWKPTSSKRQTTGFPATSIRTNSFDFTQSDVQVRKVKRVQCLAQELLNMQPGLGIKPDFPVELQVPLFARNKGAVITDNSPINGTITFGSPARCHYLLMNSNLTPLSSFLFTFICEPGNQAPVRPGSSLQTRHTNFTD